MNSVPASIFKDCDIRGLFGSDLTPEIAYRIGRAVGAKLPGKRLLVGGDLRPHTPPLQAQIIEALKASGCLVLDLGQVPTPVFHSALSQLTADGGVMVTASHNPPQFNGFKLMLGPLPPIREDFEEIERMVAEGAQVSGQGRVEKVPPIPQYQEQLIRRFTPAGPLKVALDCGNGSYSEIAPPVFRQLGYEVVELFCQPDGTFPNRDPNPAIPAHLSALCAAVSKSNAQLGVAFDGDGDRVAFTDENGQVLPAEHVLVLLARRLLMKVPLATIVFDIKGSRMVEEEALRLGCVFVEEKSGHSYIRRRMILNQADLGGEVSGHFFYKALRGGDDGLYTSLLLAQILDQTGQPLSQLTRGLDRYQITPDFRLPYDISQAPHLLRRLRDHFTHERLSTLDGVKVYFQDGWGILRPSVTEPAITIRFESTTDTPVPQIARRFLQPLPELLPLLSQKYPDWFPPPDRA